MPASGYTCCEGACARNESPRVFRDQGSFRQHYNRCHKNAKGEETSVGRALKRQRDGAATEESRKRQWLEEARTAAEGARRMPELAPVDMICA